jgi:hypothetical protein
MGRKSKMRKRRTEMTDFSNGSGRPYSQYSPSDYRGGHGYGGHSDAYHYPHDRDEKGRFKGKAAEPPIDPKVMEALQAALTDRRLTLLEGPPTLADLTHPITVLVDAAGAWEVRKNDIGLFCRKLDKVPGIVPVMKAGVALAVPRLPWEAFAQTVVFFREVNRLHRAEAYVQWWYRPEGAASPGSPAGYYPHVPLQDVSGGGVDHLGDHQPGDGSIHVLDIHSHHTMDAYFSPTDDGDEKKSNRLFGVVGRIDKPIPASKWRACSAGTFLDLTMEDVVEIPTEEHKFVVDFSVMIKAGGSLTIPVSVDPFAGVEFPEEWLKALITTKRVAGYVIYDNRSSGVRGYLPQSSRILPELEEEEADNMIEEFYRRNRLPHPRNPDIDPPTLPPIRPANVITGRQHFWLDKTLGKWFAREYFHAGGHRDTEVKFNKHGKVIWP